jgi:hypothetical protein
MLLIKYKNHIKYIINTVSNRNKSQEFNISVKSIIRKF